MSEERRTTEELLFELEQVKRADEDHFQSLLDDMEKIQAERDRLKAENTRLHSTHDGHGAASTPRGRAASPSATAVRDRASGSTKHDPERAASHKEPLGRLTEGATTHKDRDPASEKAIAERRLRELAASGFRKRARSPERNQRARDPTPPRKERRRTSGSRSRTRSRDRQRPRSRGRDLEHSRDRLRHPRGRSDRDRSREHGQRADQGRRRYSRSPHSPQRQSERTSPQPSQSPSWQRGKDVLALPGPAQAQSSSAMTVLDPGFAEHLQSMVAPLAALGPALEGIVSILQAVPAAISGLKIEMSERDARNQQELQHITKQNQGLQDELSKVNAKIKTGSEKIDKNSMDVDKLKDDLEAEKIAAAERARRAEASSRALREQQAQAGAALASVQKHMQDMPSKSAVDPRKTEEELTRLCKQVELLEAERQQPAASSAPAAAMQRQQDETGQHRFTADAPAPSAGQEQHTGSNRRQSILGFQRNVRKQHLPPVEPEGLEDFAASVWGPRNTSVKPALPPWRQQALEHISCKPATAGAAWPARPVDIMRADVARAVSAALQHTPSMPAGSLQLNRQHPGLMQGVRPAGLAPGQPQASSAPIRPIVPSHASAAQSQKQQRGSSWAPKGPGPVRGATGPALSQGAPPWVQEAQRVSDMLTAQVYSDRWQPTQVSTVPQPNQFALPAPQPVAPLPAPTAPATVAGPSVGPGVFVPQGRLYISESPLCSQPFPSSSQARQHPSDQGSPARPALLASTATESPSRPVASMAAPSKPRSDSLQQPSAAAGLCKASESIAEGTPALASVRPAAQHAQAASQQAPALSGAPSSQGVALAKQSAALAGASMSQAHAKVPAADKLVQQMPASQPNAVILTGSAARQDSLGTGPEGARGTDGRRVESESKNQRRKRQREEAQQAAGAAPCPRSQQTPEAQSKRAKSHHKQATAQQVSAAPKVHAMPPLSADFICGICERAYSNSAALHLHLVGNEHHLKLSHPKSRQGKAGEEGGSPETVVFRRSFPWSCKLCGRDFALMRQLVAHSSNSDKHTQLLQAVLRKDRDEAKEDGEVAGFGPILAGQALREAWAKQNSSPADHARQEALESPSRLQVVVLDDSTAPSGSMSTLVDQHTGQAARVGRDGGTTAGWQYESPQHVANREGSRHQSREGSVEDGELPRMPVHFSLASSKPVTPQTVPSAQPRAQPTATAAQKPGPSPSDRAIQAPIASSAPHGPGAPAQPNAAAVEKDSFLPPHLKGLVSPNLKAPTPPQSELPQPTSSAGIAVSKAGEKAMLQPQKLQSHTGHQARAPAAAPKASGLAKQAPNMPASTAMPQASTPHGIRASGLQSPSPAAASTLRSSAAPSSSSARAGPASSARQASGATGAPAVMRREATDQGRRASAVAASQLRTTSASVSTEPGTSAGEKGSASAGRATVAATPMTASKGQPAPFAKAAPVSQKPTARPAAAKVIQTGGAAPPVSAAASAALPMTSVPLPAEAIAAATSFLNDLGKANSAPSEALGSAPSGFVQPAAGHLGSKPRSAQQTQPAQSLPKLPANPPSPEMRLESLMQELSNMAHRLPNATPAQPLQQSAGPSVAASRAAAPSASSLHQAVSRSASPASGMPLRVSAPPWQPQQAGRATAARSIAARQGRGSSNADVTASEKLRKEIAELHQVIDLKVREARRKGAAGKAVPQGQKQPAQLSQAAPGSAAPIIAKAKAEVPKASEQPSKGPSPAPNLASKQAPQSSGAVPGSLAAQGEQTAPAQSSKAAEPTSKLATAGHSTGRQTPQAAAPASSPLAAQGKQRTVADGQRASARTSTPASEASTGEATTSPAKASVVAPHKQHSCTSGRATLAPKQPLASSVSSAARAGGTQLPSSRPSALGPVPASQSAAPASGPQVRGSQPSAAPVAGHHAAKQAVQEPQQVERPQMPSMSAPPPLKQADTSSAGVPDMHASAKPPMAHGQGGPAASSQRSVKAPAVPTSPHGPAQPSVMPASAGKEPIHLAAHKDRAERPAMSQPSASAATATRAAPSQAQPVMPDVTPKSDKPQERAVWPTADTQPCQPDTHTKVGKAGAMSAAATPPAGGSVWNGTDERPALSAQPVAKQREHASSTTPEDCSGREAPHRLNSAAAAPLQAGKRTPLPVLALEDNTWTNPPSSSGTPAYTMLTQTPLGTGSAWPATAQNKANSQPAPVLAQQRKTPHLTPTPDRQSEPTNGRAAAGAGEGSVPGSFKAGQRADAAGQTPRASSPYSRTPPSGHRAARGRVMTTGRRPVQATPKKPSPPGVVAGDKAANIDGEVVSGQGKSRVPAGAASEPSGAGSSARHQTALGSSAGFMERSGGRAGHTRSHMGTSSQSGRSLGSAHVAEADGGEGINTTGSGKVAGVSTDIGRNSAVTNGEQVSRERQQPSGTAAPSVSRAQAGDRLATGIQESQDTPAELEDMDIDIMTVSHGNSAGHLLKLGRSAPSMKADKKHLQGTASLAAACPDSTQRGRLSPDSRQSSPVAAAQSGASHKAVSAPAASPAIGTAPPQPALDVGIRAPLSAAERPSPGGAAQPRKHSPAMLQSAGQGTGSSATAKAAPASASMSKPAAAKPAALPPQPQNPESRAHRAVEPPARAAPLTVQEQVDTGEATQAEPASVKTALATAQRKASQDLVPKAVQSPPKLAAPSLQQKKPLEALPKPGVAPQHKTAEATSAKVVQAPVTSRSQGQQDESALKTLPKPAQAPPARAAAAALSNSAAPPPPAKDKVPAGITNPAPAVKNPAGPASLAKAPSPAPSKVRIPAPKQAPPASSAQAVQAPAKYSFLYPQKEDSTAANSQKLSRFAVANRSAASAPKPAPHAQKVHTTRMVAAGASAGGAHRPQHSAGQGPAQGQSSKRIVTISHESLAGNGMIAQNPRPDFEASEPGEMRIPLQMPPMPVHMRPLQDPSQGAPFSQERTEDPRYLPRQGPPMEWFHPESMSMASLPQPWHVHERQMSGHRGHAVELQAQQRFGAPDGRLPRGEEERQQGMQSVHLPPQLPPLPMHMPPGEPAYNSQGHFPQQFLSDEGMGRSEHYGLGPGLPPGLCNPDFGRPHSQGFGMYGTPEQLPFPTR